MVDCGNVGSGICGAILYVQMRRALDCILRLYMLGYGRSAAAKGGQQEHCSLCICHWCCCFESVMVWIDWRMANPRLDVGWVYMPTTYPKEQVVLCSGSVLHN